jgi:protein SCO1/2
MYRLPLKNLWILICTLLLLGCSQKEKFNHVDITGSSSFSPAFELQDHHGQVRNLEDFKGKVLVVFFGFTQCPDVCPSTM